MLKKANFPGGDTLEIRKTSTLPDRLIVGHGVTVGTLQFKTQENDQAKMDSTLKLGPVQLRVRRS